MHGPQGALKHKVKILTPSSIVVPLFGHKELGECPEIDFRVGQGRGSSALNSLELASELVALNILDQVPMQGAASIKFYGKFLPWLRQLYRSWLGQLCRSRCSGGEDSAGSCAVVNDDDCAESCTVTRIMSYRLSHKLSYRLSYQRKYFSRQKWSHLEK